MDDVKILKGDGRHAVDLAELYRDHTFAGANGPLPGWVAYSPEQFAQMAAAPQVRMVVAEAGGRAVGIAQAFDMVTWGYVDLVVVHKEWRQHGLGLKLLAAIPTDGWVAAELCYLNAHPGLGVMARRAGFKICDGQWTWCHRMLTDAPSSP